MKTGNRRLLAAAVLGGVAVAAGWLGFARLTAGTVRAIEPGRSNRDGANH